MLRHVRASVQMAAVRPAISLGLRAATATVPALVFGQLTGRPGLLWMSLGGWLGTLADPGGPYPLRAAAMAGYLVFGARAGAGPVASRRDGPAAAPAPAARSSPAALGAAPAAPGGARRAGGSPPARGSLPPSLRAWAPRPPPPTQTDGHPSTHNRNR